MPPPPPTQPRARRRRAAGRQAFRFANSDAYEGMFADDDLHGPMRVLLEPFVESRHCVETEMALEHACAVLSRRRRCAHPPAGCAVPGPGRKVYACGDVYDGEWAKGQRHGRGVMTYADPREAAYDGEWRFDERCAPRPLPPPLVLSGHAASLTPY